MTVDRTSWNTLWVSSLEELTRRSTDAWRPYFQEFVNMLGMSSSMRSSAGEWASRYHSFQRDQLTDIPPSLDFDYDDAAESAGPRSAPLPPGWNAAGVIAVTGQGGSRPLLSQNVMTRVENGRLTVALVNLGQYHPHQARVVEPGGPSGIYSLQSDGGPEVTITTTHIK